MTATAERIDVWQLTLVATPTQTDRLCGLLDPWELGRAERLLSPGSRSRFVVAHGLTRLVLARYTGVEPAALRWTIGPHGKPGPVHRAGRAGTPDAGGPVHWNLSHSGEHALLAVSSLGALGVDVQVVAPVPSVRHQADVLAAARRFLTGLEYARVAARRGAAARREEYLRALARKEAWAKAQGVRLFDVLRVDPDRARGGGPGGQGWTLTDIGAPPGCVAALALPATASPSTAAATTATPGAPAAPTGSAPVVRRLRFRFSASRSAAPSACADASPDPDFEGTPMR